MMSGREEGGGGGGRRREMDKNRMRRGGEVGREGKGNWFGNTINNIQNVNIIIGRRW